MKIYIRKCSDRSIVNEIDVTSKTELQIEMLLRNALMNIDSTEQFVDDSEVHKKKIEENKNFF